MNVRKLVRIRVPGADSNKRLLGYLLEIESIDVLITRSHLPLWQGHINGCIDLAALNVP